MRIVILAILAGGAMLLQAGPGAAQKKTDKKTDKTPEVTSENAEIGGKNLYAWVKEIHSKDKSESENAIRTVMLFPPKLAVKAVPELLGILKKSGVSNPLDVSIKVNSCMALGAILGGVPPKERDEKEVTDTITELHKLLRDNQAVVKVRAAQALMVFGPEAKVAIGLLRTTLKSTYEPNWELRKVSALALGHIAFETKKGPSYGPHPEVLADLYDRAKKDSSFQVRLAALQALAWLGPPRDTAGKALMEKTLAYVAANDPRKEVQIWGHMAVIALKEGLKEKVDAAHLSAIGKMLDSKELPVRLQAVQALGTLGPKAKSEVPRLIAGLKDPDGNFAAGCMLALASIGKDSDEAVTAIGKMLDSKEPALRLQAVQALAALGPRAKSQVPRLVEGLKDVDGTFASGCILALASIGKDAGDAVPHLKKLIQKDSPEALRQVVNEAIDVIQGKTKGKTEPKKEAPAGGER
jgi:HEAT repeat protein